MAYNATSAQAPDPRRGWRTAEWDTPPGGINTAAKHQGSHIQYRAAWQQNVMASMRDGSRLAMDIYLPGEGDGRAASGGFPTILERTPYGKDAPQSVVTGRYFASRGYACIFQDVRGRGASEGDWLHMFNPKDEARDGYDTLAWILRQPWSDGKVGTIGVSYTGATQQALAITNPPGLAAQFVIDCGINYHTHAFRSGGAFNVGMVLPFFFRMAQDSPEARANPEVRRTLARALADIPEWLSRLPLQRGGSPLALVPGYEEIFFQMAEHANYDAFWKNPTSNLEEYLDRYPDIPLCYLTSWYGLHPWATGVKFNEMGKRLRSPVRLMIGTWMHGEDTLADWWSGDVDFGVAAALDNLNDLRLKWFDHWLKGMATDILEGPPVRIFVMGGGGGRKTPRGKLYHGGAWRGESAWPPASTRSTGYYLHSTGALSPEKPSAGDATRQFEFDPTHPVPTIGGFGAPGTPGVISGGAYDQRGNPRRWFTCADAGPLASRPDVLVFQTEPLGEPIEVVGPVEVHLYAASSAIDTDFTAKLIDVCPPNEDYPEGFAMNLCDGLIRARYRGSREKPEMMTPGQVYEFIISLQVTGNLFARGHRIRLDISSSNFPWFDVNPNTGAASWAPGDKLVAHQTIHCDARHPSQVVLPITHDTPLTFFRYQHCP